MPDVIRNFIEFIAPDDQLAPMSKSQQQTGWGHQWPSPCSLLLRCATRASMAITANPRSILPLALPACRVLEVSAP